MPNRIKEIFSDDAANINGTLRFSNEDAYKSFLSALEIAYAEGRVVPVDGVTSVSTTVGHPGIRFPLEEHTSITQFVVGPSIEPIPITFNVDGEEKTITFLRSQLKDKVILRSEPDSIVTFNFAFPFDQSKHTFNYKVQFEKAKSICEVADSFSLATGLLAHLYSSEDNPLAEDGKVSLANVTKYFRCYESFFRRLSAIENKLALSISPSLLNNLSYEEQQDIDELYLLLFEKKIVRLNAKLTSTNSTLASMNYHKSSLDIGSEIALTFISTIDFNFLKHTVTLHTANLLINAIVKEIRKCDDGTVRILYGDTDSKPMYIAFSAFEAKEDAEKEVGIILKHAQLYKDALTSTAYINRFYSDPV